MKRFGPVVSHPCYQLPTVAAERKLLSTSTKKNALYFCTTNWTTPDEWRKEKLVRLKKEVFANKKKEKKISNLCDVKKICCVCYLYVKEGTTKNIENSFFSFELTKYLSSIYYVTHILTPPSPCLGIMYNDPIAKPPTKAKFVRIGWFLCNRVWRVWYTMYTIHATPLAFFITFQTENQYCCEV